MIPRFITKPDPTIYLGDNYVATDFETTNIEKGSALASENRLLLSCWKASKDRRGNKTWGSEYAQPVLLESLASASFIVAHNAKFELQWLKRMGADLTKILVWDTMIAEKVLAGNKMLPLDLGSVATRYGLGGKDPYVDLCMKAGVCPSELPGTFLEKRCLKDVEQTENIFLQQRELLREAGLLGVMYTRCIFTPVLADIEFNGIQLDDERVTSEYSDYHRRFLGCERRVGEFTGGINPRSTKQKAEFIYDTLGFKELRGFDRKPKRTAKGGRCTDTETILKLKATNKRQRQYITLQKEYNSLNAALTKSLEFFYGVCKEWEGNFKGTFNQSVARTHRLTASGRKIYLTLFKKKKSCQFQNLPRSFKRLFKARREGWKIGEIDGAQLEFRVAGYLGRDSVILSDIRSGSDVHQYTADTLTAAGELTNRQDAKSRTFKPLYGGESGTTAEKEYYAAFKEKYAGVAKAQELWISDVLAKKELVTCTGLKFYWPDTTRSKSGYVNNKRSICNYPVQSLATADIIPIAVTMLWHDMKDKEMESYLVNTIHDSAIAELNPRETELFSEIAVKAFTDYVYYYLKEVYNIEFFIPLGAGVKIGDHWSEGEEIKYESRSPYEYPNTERTTTA